VATVFFNLEFSWSPSGAVGGLSANVTLDSDWAVKNEGAIVDALAATLDVKANQIQIVSIAPVDAAGRRLQASVTRSGGFSIHFVVDVDDEEDIIEVKDAVVNLVQADSEVQEAFVTELHSELQSRDAPVPAELKTLRPKSANSEVWLRGSTYYDVDEEQDLGSWIVGGWEPCEGSCGRSYQNRSVECSAEDVAFCIGPKPPIFRECKHPNPCPDPNQTCKFGCSPGWWVFVLVTLATILICLGTCVRVCSRRMWSACGKQEDNFKASASKGVTADVNSQAQRCMEPEVQAKSNQAEVPTLLQSLSQEQTKSSDLHASASTQNFIHASQHDVVKDVEAGIVLQLKDEVELSGSNVADLVQWLTNVDTSHLKIPAIPKGAESEVAGSQV